MVTTLGEAMAVSAGERRHRPAWLCSIAAGLLIGDTEGGRLALAVVVIRQRSDVSADDGSPQAAHDGFRSPAEDKKAALERYLSTLIQFNA